MSSQMHYRNNFTELSDKLSEYYRIMELKNNYIPRSAVILSISTKTCHKIFHIDISPLIKITSPLRKSRSRPGFEPGTSRTLSGNHTPRPTRHGCLFISKSFERGPLTDPSGPELLLPPHCF